MDSVALCCAGLGWAGVLLLCNSIMSGVLPQMLQCDFLATAGWIVGKCLFDSPQALLSSFISCVQQQETYRS